MTIASAGSSRLLPARQCLFCRSTGCYSGETASINVCAALISSSAFFHGYLLNLIYAPVKRDAGISLSIFFSVTDTSTNLPGFPAGRTFHKVQKVSFGVGEEQDAPCSTGGF